MFLDISISDFINLGFLKRNEIFDIADLDFSMFIDVACNSSRYQIIGYYIYHMFF